MKAIAVAIAMLVGSFAFAQDSSDPKFLERARAALAKHVQADIAVTHNGEELNIARSDLRLEFTGGKRFKLWIRVNILPYMPGAKEKIIAKLNENEDIIGAVSHAIHQSVRNQIAARLGIPAEFVVVPAPVLQAALAANLKTAVATFVDSKITSEAQLDAAVRELAVAFSIVGDADAPTQLVVEGGKLDPMYARDNGYFTNQFALSTWGARATFRRQVNDTWGIKAYVSASDDAGLWENADMNASNPNAAFIANIIARKSTELFDLNEFNAYEVGVINTVGNHTYLVSVGIRPVLDRGVDSRYVLSRYDGTLMGMRVDAQGSLESFEDPVFGATLVKRFEAGIAKEFKGYTVSGRGYSRYDSFVRKDGAIIQAALTKEIWSTDNMTMGLGGRVYTSKLHGVDDNGNAYARNNGWDAGMAIKFGRATRPNPSEVLSKRDQALNAERLKAQKKSENK